MTTNVVISFEKLLYDNKCCDTVQKCVICQQILLYRSKTCYTTINVVILFENVLYDNKGCDIVRKRVI